MSNAGRNPKPTALKIDQGTDRKDRVLENEVQPTTIIDTIPPDDLDDLALAEWNYVVPELKRLGILTIVDLSIIKAYCLNMGRYFKSVKEVATEGEIMTIPKTGYKMPNPWIAIGNKALKNAIDIGVQYGFTPASRTRIAAPKPIEEDGWDKMLREKAERMAKLKVHPIKTLPKIRVV